jgi:hypothetical protein
MLKLKDSVSSSKMLSEALQKNGASHKSYKMYTSMDRALEILVSGHLYLFDGNNWNDKSDRDTMKAKSAFAKCFSCSTNENVAMWMLYGNKAGKNGAMLNFYHSTINLLINVKYIELGKFSEKRKFDSVYTLNSDADYEIFATDIIYAEKCSNGKVKLTLGDEHITTNDSILDDADVFYKKYPWSYEKECRLVVRIADKWNEVAVQQNLNCIRLTIPESHLKKLKDGRLIRSPIYSGWLDYGEPSLLTGDVDWNL